MQFVIFHLNFNDKIVQKYDFQRHFFFTIPAEKSLISSFLRESHLSLTWLVIDCSRCIEIVAMSNFCLSSLNHNMILMLICAKV